MWLLEARSVLQSNIRARDRCGDIAVAPASTSAPVAATNHPLESDRLDGLRGHFGSDLGVEGGLRTRRELHVRHTVPRRLEQFEKREGVTAVPGAPLPLPVRKEGKRDEGACGLLGFCPFLACFGASTGQSLAVATARGVGVAWTRRQKLLQSAEQKRKVLLVKNDVGSQHHVHRAPDILPNVLAPDQLRHIESSSAPARFDRTLIRRGVWHANLRKRWLEVCQEHLGTTDGRDHPRKAGAGSELDNLPLSEQRRRRPQPRVRFCEVRCQHHTSVPDHLAQPAGLRVEELELLAAHNINAPQSILPAAEVLGQYGVGSCSTLGLMSCCLLRGYLWTLARGGGGEGHGGADGS
eukprot:m.263883 g.263883  ORF g.263883 m.263883 type:complete len:352 (+) comp16016_c1_seq3:747-1802(+)